MEDWKGGRGVEGLSGGGKDEDTVEVESILTTEPWRCPVKVSE